MAQTTASISKRNSRMSNKHETSNHSYTSNGAMNLTSQIGFDFDETQLAEYADEELVQIILRSSTVNGHGNVFLLAHNLVAKSLHNASAEDELAAMQLASSLHIRVPIVRRVVRDRDNVFAVMDRIYGHTLEEAWMGLGWFQTIKCALQLRGFVRSMRAIKSPTAGALTTGICSSIWLADYYGPPVHPNHETLASYITFWILHRRKGETTPEERALVLPTPKNLVFTHQDLAPRNMMVDRSNQLWVVDWQYAGWYPEYFEYKGMNNFDTVKMLKHWGSHLRWFLFTWLSVGSYALEARALGMVAYKSTRFPIARKALVLPPGAHFDALQLRRPGL